MTEKETQVFTLQSGFIFLPPHTIDSRRSLTLQSVEAVA